MAIEINSVTNRDMFNNIYSLHTKTGNNEELIVLSGIVNPNIRTRDIDLRKEELVVKIVLGGILPRGKVLKILQIAPIISLNSFFLDDDKGGHFSLGGGLNDGIWLNTCHAPNPNEIVDTITIKSNIWLYNKHAALVGVAYSITLTGEFIDRQRIY